MAMGHGVSCTEHPELFGQDEGVTLTPKQVKNAERLCAGCSIVEVCRSLAEQHGPSAGGVWAGVYYGGGKLIKPATQTRIIRIPGRCTDEPRVQPYSPTMDGHNSNRGKPEVSLTTRISRRPI